MAPLFVLLAGSVASAETLDQSYDDEVAATTWCSVRSGIVWWQTFTHGTLDDLSRAEVYIQFPFDFPVDPLHVAIVTTDTASIPTATVIASTTVTAAEAKVGLGGLKKGWLSVGFSPPVELEPGSKYGIRLSSSAAELKSYEWRATNMRPLEGFDPYPAGQQFLSVGGASPSGQLRDALFRTWVGPRDDLDGDGLDDSIDPDDDGDGVDDVVDNCPIDGNPLQEDDDLDGLGNACDPEFNSDAALAGIQEAAADTVSMLTVSNPPGVNGLIAKLSGNGSVPTKVSQAFSAFSSGAIDQDEYLSRLNDALLQLDGFDAQIAAKLEAGRISPEDAALISAESSSIRATILMLAQPPGEPPVLPG